MFLEKYLDSSYLDLVYDNYEEEYIRLIDEENFNKVYLLLKNYNFYFIDDIIINYLELFAMDAKYVQLALANMNVLLGYDFVKQIGQNMQYMAKIIDLATLYDEIESM